MKLKPLHVGLLAVAGLGAAYLALAPAAGAKILPPPQPPPPPPMPTPPTLVNAVVTVPRETVPNEQRGMLKKALGPIAAQMPGSAAFLNVLITSEMGGLLVGKLVGVFLQIEGGGPGYWYLPVSVEAVITFPRSGVVASLQAPLLQTLPQTNPDAASFFTMKKGNVYSIIEKPFNPSTDPGSMPFPSAVYPSMNITEGGTGDVNRPDAPPPGARRVTGTFNGTGVSPTSNYEDLKFLPPRTSGVYILAVIDVSAQNIKIGSRVTLDLVKAGVPAELAAVMKTSPVTFTVNSYGTDTVNGVTHQRVNLLVAGVPGMPADFQVTVPREAVVAVLP